MSLHFQKGIGNLLREGVGWWWWWGGAHGGETLLRYAARVVSGPRRLRLERQGSETPLMSKGE